MSRHSTDFKCRTWDGKKLLYFNPFNIDNELDPQQRSHINLNDWPVEQWIGIADKNGKCIYEGDIIKWISIFDDEPTIRHGEVFFKTEGSIDYCIRVHKEGNFGLNGYDRKNYEIVGNIHENVELLEKGIEHETKENNK